MSRRTPWSSILSTIRSLEPATEPWRSFWDLVWISAGVAMIIGFFWVFDWARGMPMN